MSHSDHTSCSGWSGSAKMSVTREALSSTMMWTLLTMLDKPSSQAISTSMPFSIKSDGVTNFVSSITCSPPKRLVTYSRVRTSLLALLLFRSLSRFLFRCLCVREPQDIVHDMSRWGYRLSNEGRCIGQAQCSCFHFLFDFGNDDTGVWRWGHYLFLNAQVNQSVLESLVKRFWFYGDFGDFTEDRGSDKSF